jgi:hypothetical protein
MTKPKAIATKAKWKNNFRLQDVNKYDSLYVLVLLL